ncbi:hypothetical protein Chor_001395 [Crotalus horridus]
MERPGARQLLLGLWVACSALSGIRGDFCDVNPCQNGGTCLKSLDESPFFCLCAEGFTGPTCNETEKEITQATCASFEPVSEKFIKLWAFLPNPLRSIQEMSNHLCAIFASYKARQGPLRSSWHQRYAKPDNQPAVKMSWACRRELLQTLSLQHHRYIMALWVCNAGPPELARLHNSGFVNAWRASNEDKKPWIQVLVQEEASVQRAKKGNGNIISDQSVEKNVPLLGLLLKGAGRLGASEFVRTYKVSYSLDGRVFEFYKDENENHEKIFSGNTDKYTAVTNMFNSPVIAQYFRIHPVTYEGGYTLRFELIGCEMNVYFNTAGCSDPLGVKSHRISDQQITASSVYKTWGLSSMTWHPYYARLDNTGKSNAWTALRNKPGEWLQGARDFGHIQYVAAYKVAYSNDGKSWTVYHDDNSNSIKLFQGNHDNNSHKKNMFDVPFHARFVRILPEAWHNRITLRVELLGCDE